MAATKTKRMTKWDLHGEHADLVVKAKELRLSPVRNGRLLPVDELREIVREKLAREAG